ncbi:hypothetical protein Tco_1111834 [Tanacetum coccineum]|uniref:Uncharacterized protein n=1 Tax=Tanacetum coccineum TaxID=301880 RepID=A0ABQ5IMR5_9ASTR
MDHECFDIRDNDFEEELKEQRIKDQEFLDTFKELCDNVLKMQKEERERIAKEKEAEELEAERKKKECLKIENSLPKASTRSRRSRIDPSLKGFKVKRPLDISMMFSMDNGEDIIPLMRISKETGLPEKIIDKSLSESFVSRMNVCQPIPITPDVPILETVNSLKMGEVHFDTSKDSFESSVRDSFSIPRESNDLSNGVIEDFQNEFNNEKNSNSETIADLPIKDSLLMGNSMESKFKGFENVLFEQNEEFSSYDESSSKVENKFDTFKCFSNPLFELDEEIITLEKDVFQNEVISNQEKINDTCETEGDLKFFDDLLNENPLPPDVSNVENDFQDNKEEIDISCDMIPPGIDTDDDSEGDVPPFEEPLDNVLFPLPKVDILPIEVEPVEVMFNDSHTYGENISQVEREFLSMVDELLKFSNDDETFDPGGGENDVLLNNGENNDLNVFTIRTFLPFVTYPEVLPASYSTGSEDKVFKPGIFDNVLTRKSSLTLKIFDPLHPPLMDFHVTKAFSGFTFSLLKLFSKKFFEPRIKNAKVFRILEDSWFNIVEEQSNAHNFH